MLSMHRLASFPILNMEVIFCIVGYVALSSLVLNVFINIILIVLISHLENDKMYEKFLYHF